MRLADFIDSSIRMDNPEQLFGAYLDSVAEFGVDRVMYIPVRNTPYEDKMFPGLSHCYPQDWLSYYVENGYGQIDPTLIHGVGVRDAFSWKSMMSIRDLSPKQDLMMHQGKEAGLNDGVGVPLHGPMGECYGLGLASNDPNPDIERHIKAIQLLSSTFHQLYVSLHDEARNAAGVSLTARETEVLQWISVGKSNWAIGEILNISEHGVDFHVRNILRKLDADSRITAVVKALQAGMIAL